MFIIKFIYLKVVAVTKDFWFIKNDKKIVS